MDQKQMIDNDVVLCISKSWNLLVDFRTPTADGNVIYLKEISFKEKSIDWVVNRVALWIDGHRESQSDCLMIIYW